jgi:hypothetical protein
VQLNLASSGRKNAILATAIGYDLAALTPCVRTWRQHVPSADLILFHRGLSARTRSALADLGVKLMRFPRSLFASRHFQVARYQHYRAFLTRCSYERVLLSDVRDVLFQRDPFEIAQEHPILFAVERKMIADCPYNSMWIDRLIGTTERLEINQKPVICSGTTLGTLSSIRDYLDRFTQEADRYSRALSVIGIDQGIHNLLIHLRGVSGAIDNDEHVFATLGYAPTNSIKIDADRILVDGKAPAVVHQWDRHELLRDWVAATFTPVSRAARRLQREGRS